MPGMRGANLMHWFWRATVAVVVSTGLGMGLVWISGTRSPPHLFGRVMQEVYDKVGVVLGAGILFFLPTVLAGMGAYGLLTKYLGPRVVDSETRCRNCGYILRGISEPRCPECGERI